MSGIIFPFSVPQESNFDVERDFEKFDSQGDFQSKQIEDQYRIFEKKANNGDMGFKKQKKSYFNPVLWTLEDEKKLIQLHKKIGNKWTALSRYFPGSCQNSIKNHFYSRLRKSIRKLNKNLAGLFGKRYSKFNLNIIFKISNASEGKVIGKCQVENSIQQFYKDFIYKLIDFSDQDEENVEIDRVDMKHEVQDYTLSLIALENLFRIVSGQRVYKGKKKNIAYLKRFNFKLDSEGQKTLVISKENCFISDHPVNIDSQSEKGSQSYLLINQLEQEQSIPSDLRKDTISTLPEEKSEQAAYGQNLASQCQKSAIYDSLSYATGTQSPASPYQSCLLDDQMRQYEITLTSESRKWYENLLDEYSGKKFHFDIEC